MVREGQPAAVVDVCAKVVAPGLRRITRLGPDRDAPPAVTEAVSCRPDTDGGRRALQESGSSVYQVKERNGLAVTGRDLRRMPEAETDL